MFFLFTWKWKLLECIFCFKIVLINSLPCLQIRDSTGARIMFPTDKDDDKEVITIVGKKESVEKAKAELEATIKEIVSKLSFVQYHQKFLKVDVQYSL